MKKIYGFTIMILLLIVSQPTNAQKYKTSADTVRLNQELLTLRNDIAELTSKLTVAQNNLPNYHNKASNASSEAQSTALENSKQASKANGGDVGDARRAEKRAKRALRGAKNARSADEKVKGEEKRIEKLTADIQKKQEKLQSYEAMLQTIRMKAQ